MARFTVRGFEELSSAWSKAADIPEGVTDSMLERMSEIIKNQIPESYASLHGGAAAFLNALTKKKPKKDGEGKSVSITYKGVRHDATHLKGTREAEIAFLNEFGVPSKGQPAIGFMKHANEEKGDEAAEAGAEIFFEWQEKNGL